MLTVKPRGPKPYPHWHDANEWVKHTTMTRRRFISMTAAEFADWCVGGDKQDVQGFFYAMRWSEGYTYCRHDWDYALGTHVGLAQHLHNWHPALLTEDERTEQWLSTQMPRLKALRKECRPMLEKLREIKEFEALGNKQPWTPVPVEREKAAVYEVLGTALLGLLYGD